MGEENVFLDHGTGTGLLVTVSINQSLKLPDKVCSVFRNWILVRNTRRQNKVKKKEKNVEYRRYTY